MVTFNPKMILIKCTFTTNLSFINLYNLFFGLESQKIKLVILLCWFAAQQQTSSCRRLQSYSILHYKVTLTSQNPGELTKRLQKPNNARKRKIYVFRGLRVKALVTNLQNYPKQYFFGSTWSMVTFNLKMILIKYVSPNNLTFMKP